MAGREAHAEEEEEEIEVEEEEEEEEGDEEDDSCYSFSDDEEEEVGDEGGGESDDFSSSNGDEAGEPVPTVKKFPAKLKPVRTTVKGEEGAPAWPPAAPPPGFTQLSRRRTPPLKPYPVSASVPGSRSSSPRSPSGANLMTEDLQKWNRRRSRRSSSNLNPQSRRRSSARLPGGQEADQLWRSKSCGEGRASQPPDEMDIWPKIAVSGRREPESVADSVGEGPAGAEKSPTKPNPRADDGFKCGAFCMFLPGFSKGKQVQPHNREASNGRQVTAARISVASRAASLEKFECGSWSSSVILSGAREEEGIPASYFDLPLELMRGGCNDTDSPVKAAFVFDRDRRGLLKATASKGAASSRRSTHDSPGRHVTFSPAGDAATHASVPSSPTAFCISPRLRKARDDFNAFLEAQNA